MTWSARSFFVAALLLLLPAGSSAQSMQDVLSDLFVFAGGEDPLFLAGSAGIPDTEVHGDHFIPAETEANDALLTFFNNAVASNIANIPLSSTVASETFTFVDGVPTSTSESFGPIFAERAQTLGKGRFDAGFNFSRIRFSKLRGVALDDLRMTFLHENVDFPGCDDAFGADCSEFGVPEWEHDRLVLDLDLHVEAEVYAFQATFGLHDRVDVGFAVPVVDLELSGASTARVFSSTGLPVSHFLDGTPDEPVLEATGSARGATTGVGDVALRAKGWLVRSDVADFAVLGEARVPTGREEDFLGAGATSLRGLFVASASFGDFSPHANVGYSGRGGEAGLQQVDVVAGFDHRLADWATLAVDVLGAFRMDDELDFPEPAVIPGLYRRTVDRVNLPDRRDDLVDGSFGFKLRTESGVVVMANVLVPLNDGGLRAGIIPTLGVEYTP